MTSNIQKFTDVAMTEANPNWQQAIKRETELYGRDDDIRSPFARDYTRVLHSLAYRRLKHKTQVFYNAAGNDHICTRSEHVLHVESVSSTIAMRLGLNEELTKAIAMSHDLGHAPFGHQGEKILSALTEQYLGKKFWHEQNGVYIIDNVELLEDNQRMLQNLNLTYAVRDGVISHCGEVDQNGLKPRAEMFDLSEFKKAGEYQASTWEGCVVKMADKIAYLGRDIEDAIRLGFIDDDKMAELLALAKIGNESAINTTVIMHNMIIDLCENSSPENGLCLSDEMAEQMNKIKEFNYKVIYSNKRMNPLNKYSTLVINEIFNALLSCYAGTDTLEKLHDNNSEYSNFKFVKDFAKWLAQYTVVSPSSWAGNIAAACLNKKIYGDLSDEKKYIQAIIDFIAGMTDIYAVNAFTELLG